MGPWKASPGGLSIHAEDGELVAAVYTCDHDGRLIAAAPDLLAALRALLAHDHTDHACSCHEDDLAIAAIAKARGQA